VKALLFELKPLFLSYKTPISYQVKTSNLLPPPSALLGALFKNYVRITGGDYSPESLRNFLSNVKYTGVIVLSTDGSSFVTAKRFSVLLKHIRLERVEEEKRKEGELRTDAMLREFVHIHGKVVGTLLLNSSSVGVDMLVDALEAIEFVGNSESLTTVKVIEELDPQSGIQGDGFLMQVVSDDISKLPPVGIVEQCGKISSEPWGGRKSSEVCYVWSPLVSVGGHKYLPVKYSDVKGLTYSKVYSLYSKTLGATLVVVADGFDCLMPASEEASIATPRSRSRKKR